MDIVRPSLFQSFWMGGFESACHINRAGVRLDMLRATQHDRFVLDDYAALRRMGIRAVRDTLRWHRIEASPGVYDFSSADPYIFAAVHTETEVVWDLLHYGWPDGLDVYATDFVHRFAGFCGAVARHFRDRVGAPRWYTPINEISFLAWAAGEVGWFHPFSTGRGDILKKQLVRAWIAGVDAIRAEDRDARIVAVEPLIHTVPPPTPSDMDGRAAAQNESQWEAWEMLTGRTHPELGGGPGYADVMGVNFYHDNQWEVPGGRKLLWHVRPRDPRWVPLNQLLRAAYRRYHCPLFIGETSHVGSGRAEWIREITDEVLIAIDDAIPIQAVCLYPIMDRFDWDDPSHWHNSGLWDYAADSDGTFRRVLNEPYAEELRRSQRRLAEVGLY